MTREIDWDQNQLIKPICPGWKVFFKSKLAVLRGSVTPHISAKSHFYGLILVPIDSSRQAASIGISYVKNIFFQKYR